MADDDSPPLWITSATDVLTFDNGSASAYSRDGRAFGVVESASQNGAVCIRVDPPSLQPPLPPSIHFTVGPNTLITLHADGTVDTHGNASDDAAKVFWAAVQSQHPLVADPSGLCAFLRTYGDEATTFSEVVALIESGAWRRWVATARKLGGE